MVTITCSPAGLFVRSDSADIIDYGYKWHTVGHTMDVVHAQVPTSNMQILDFTSLATLIAYSATIYSANQDTTKFIPISIFLGPGTTNRVTITGVAENGDKQSIYVNPDVPSTLTYEFSTTQLSFSNRVIIGYEGTTTPQYGNV